MVDGNKLIIHFTNPGFVDIHKDIIHKDREYLKSVLKDVIGVSLLINCEQSKNPADSVQSLNPDTSINQSKTADLNIAETTKKITSLQRHEIIDQVRELEQNGLLKNVTSILNAELQDISGTHEQ